MELRKSSNGSAVNKWTIPQRNCTECAVHFPYQKQLRVTTLAYFLSRPKRPLKLHQVGDKHQIPRTRGNLDG